jgi:hypothetical protein
MPTTLTGVLLFVVLLLPGFAYLVGKERAGNERRMTPFRETVAIVAASLTSELVVLTVFAVLRILWPRHTPDVGALVTHGMTYVKGDYAKVTAWGAGLLMAATALSYAATLPRLRGRLPGRYPHHTTVSAWSIVFTRWHPEGPGSQVRVGVRLEDGSFLAGRLSSYNTSSDDSADRDIILRAPIDYQPPDSSETERHNIAAVTISARRILWIGTNYYSRAAPASPNEPSSA